MEQVAFPWMVARDATLHSFARLDIVSSARATQSRTPQFKGNEIDKLKQFKGDAMEAVGLGSAHPGVRVLESVKIVNHKAGKGGGRGFWYNPLQIG